MSATLHGTKHKTKEPRLTLGVFLFAVVGQSGGHREAHVAVFAMERFLSRVQTHVVLEGRGGGKLGPAFFACVRPLFKMLGALMIKQTFNQT